MLRVRVYSSRGTPMPGRPPGGTGCRVGTARTPGRDALLGAMRDVDRVQRGQHWGPKCAAEFEAFGPPILYMEFEPPVKPAPALPNVEPIPVVQAAPTLQSDTRPPAMGRLIDLGRCRLDEYLEIQVIA